MPAGVIEYSLKVNTKDGTVNLQKVGDRFDDISEKGEQAGKRGGKGLDSLFDKTFKLNQALELAKKAWNLLSGPIQDVIRTASDAEEITSKFYAVFKEEAPKAIDWVKQFSGDVGRSKTDIMGWMSTLQDTFVPLGFARDKASEMSQTLTRLAVDLSSFNNVAEADAIADLQSAIVGNHETMRKYGVIINEAAIKQELLSRGIRGGVQAASEAEKAQARLNIILRGTTDAQNDAIRTADSFENRMRAFNSTWKDLKEVAGKAIIGAITPSLQKLAEWIDKNRQKIEEFARKAGEKIGEFIGAIGDIIAWLYKSRDELIAIGKVIAVVFAASKLNDFGKGLAGIIKNLSGVFKSIASNFKDLRNEGNSVFKSLSGSIGGVGNKLGGLKGILGNLGSIATAAFVGWEIGSLINDVLGLQAATAQLHQEEMELAYMRSEEKAGITEYSKNIRQVRESVLQLGESIGVASNRLSVHAQAIFQNKEIYQALTSEQKKMVDGFVQSKEKIRIHTEAVQKAKETEEKLKKEKEAATKALEEQMKEYDKLLKGLDTFKVQQSALIELWNTKKTKILETKHGTIEYISKLDELAHKLGDEVSPKLKAVQLQLEDTAVALGVHILDVPKMTRNYLDLLPPLENTAKVFDDIEKRQFNKEIAEASKNLGFLTFEAGSLDKELKILSGVFEKSKSQLGKNTEATQNLREWVIKLIEKYKILGLDAPDALLKLKESLNEVKEETVSLGQIFTNLAQIGGQATDALEKMGVIGSKTANSISGLTSGISGIGGGFDAIKNAGKGFLGFLGKLSGGISIASGAITVLSSVITLLAGKSGELEAAERRLSGLVGVTGDWAEKIEALAKELGGAESAERAFNQLLPDIIRNTTVTTQNFDAFIRKTREIVSTFERGNATAEETAKNFGAAFQEMVNAAQALGMEGGVDMTGLIMLADEFGLKVKEIADYIDQNMKDAFAGWKDYVAGEFSSQTLPVFDEMLRLEEQVANNEALIKGIQGAAQALEGLSNTTRLSEEEFQTFENIAVDAMAKLEAQGITGRDALIHMEPLIEKLAFLQEQYGFALDESTQAMIDQGREQGILAESTQKDQKTTNELLALIAEQLGVQIPKHLRELAGLVDGEVGEIINETKKWQGSLGDIRDEIAYIGDDMSALDDAWQEHVSGNTIIAENIKWLDSLAEIEGKIYTIGDTVTWLDQEYQVFSRNIDDATRQNAISALTEMGDMIDDLGKRFGENWDEMDTKVVGLKASLDILADSIGITIPDSLTDLHDRWNYVWQAMASDTENLYLGPDGVLRNIMDTLALIGQQTADQIGSNYGVYTQAEKQQMTIQFQQMGHLWAANRGTILSSESNMRSFLRDLENLVVIDEAMAQYNQFLTSMRQWYAHLQRGETWNEESDTWLKAAKGANFIVPRGFENDTFPILASSGELVNIFTPEETREIMRIMAEMENTHTPAIPVQKESHDSPPIDFSFLPYYQHQQKPQQRTGTDYDDDTSVSGSSNRHDHTKIEVKKEGINVTMIFNFPTGTSKDMKDDYVNTFKKVIHDDYDRITGFLKDELEGYDR